MIAGHLDAVAGGKTYSQVSGEYIASNTDPTKRDATLGAQRQTLFMGETLRGLLLNTYAFSIFGTIALIGGIVALVAALVLLALSVVGYMHGRHTPVDQMVGAPHAESIPACRTPDDHGRPSAPSRHRNIRRPRHPPGPSSCPARVRW